MAQPTKTSSSERSVAAERSSSALNLPLHHDFVPLRDPADGGDAADIDDTTDDQVLDPVSDAMRDDVICMIFDLPRSTKFYQDFSCAISATLAMHGRMYPTSTHLCFYSNVFGRERKILIPYESITEITKTTTMVFQNALRINTASREEYTFSSFWGNHRDECFDLLGKIRKRVLLPGALSSGPGSGGVPPRRKTITAEPETSPKSPQSTTSASSPEPEEQQPAPPTPEAAIEAPAAHVPPAPPTAPTLNVANADENEERRSSESEERARARSRLSSSVSDVDSIAPKDISMLQIAEASFPISADAFMEMFLFDNAKFGLDEFNQRFGASEIKCNPWMNMSDTDPANALEIMTRSLHFRTPIDAPIGPKSSMVEVLQCYKVLSSKVRVIETSTRLADIPYGDYFSVETRWTIVPRRSGTCKLFIEFKVDFTKSTIWKSKIESRATAENKDRWQQWIQMAQDFLKTPEATASPPVSATPKVPRSNSISDNSASDSGIPPLVTSSLPPQPVHRRRSQGSSAQMLTRRTSRAAHSERHEAPSPLVAKVLPWLVILALLLVLVRMQTSLSSIEQSLLVTTQRMEEMQNQLTLLSSSPSCPSVSDHV